MIAELTPCLVFSIFVCALNCTKPGLMTSFTRFSLSILLTSKRKTYFLQDYLGEKLFKLLLLSSRETPVYDLQDTPRRKITFGFIMDQGE